MADDDAKQLRSALKRIADLERDLARVTKTVINLQSELKRMSRRQTAVIRRFG